MNELTAWSGFVGAWLLVVGPLYQGVLELGEEDTEHHGAHPAPAVAPPPPPSPWWWLLPPVMLLLRRRRSTTYHRTVLATLTPREREHRDRFIRKATGWFVVASGASFLAFKETWELAEHDAWSLAVFVVVLLVMLALVGGNTALHAARRAKGVGGGGGHQPEVP